jgi:hypothetical protein
MVEGMNFLDNDELCVSRSLCGLDLCMSWVLLNFVTYQLIQS